MMIEFKFLNVTFNRSLNKPSFKETYKPQDFLYFLQTCSMFFGLVFILVSAIFGSYFSKKNYWIIFPFVGVLLGFILDLLYYRKVRIPFYKKYYPNEFKKEDSKLNRNNFLISIFCENFLRGFFSFGLFIGFNVAHIG